jgi:hypothetical protein
MTNGEDLIKLDDLEFLADGADGRDPMSLIAFTLPSAPRSVQMARFCVQAALRYHQLGGYAEDALTVTSELVTNAIKHADAVKFGVEVMRLAGCEAVAIICHRLLAPSTGQAISRGGHRARARPAHRRCPVGSLGMAASGPRQGRIRDPGPGGQPREGRKACLIRSKSGR